MSSWRDKARRLDIQRSMLALFPRYISVTFLALSVATVLSSRFFLGGASAPKKRTVSALSVGSCPPRNWFPARKPWQKHLLQNQLSGCDPAGLHLCAKTTV